MIGIYYLRVGKDTLQLDLYKMAFNSSKQESGVYLIVQDLAVVKELLTLIDLHGYVSNEVQQYCNNYLDLMNAEWSQKRFQADYGGNWSLFAEKRSTIIRENYIIKHAGRMLRNFTDGSQRAGHIAVGEMYLSKYLFYGKKLLYLFPKMTSADVNYLDIHKRDDKEWNLLRTESGVVIKTMDDLIGLPSNIKQQLLSIKDEPLKNGALQIYNACVKKIVDMLNSNSITIDE